MVSDFQCQVDKAIQMEEDAKQSPREVFEANERVAKQMHKAYYADLFITCLSWSGWLVVAFMLIKGC